MVTQIYKINESIKLYKETEAKIKKIKDAFYNELKGLETQLIKNGEDIDYFKGLTEKECKKKNLIYIK